MMLPATVSTSAAAVVSFSIKFTMSASPSPEEDNDDRLLDAANLFLYRSIRRMIPSKVVVVVVFTERSPLGFTVRMSRESAALMEAEFADRISLWSLPSSQSTEIGLSTVEGRSFRVDGGASMPEDLPVERTIGGLVLLR